MPQLSKRDLNDTDTPLNKEKRAEHICLSVKSMLMLSNIHRFVPSEFVPQGQPVNQPETGLTNVI
jgi:hypothetical protein